MAAIKTIGKAKIDLDVRGCIDCGTEYSSGWEVARIVEIKIGKTVYQCEIHRCARCMKNKQELLF